jgi:hypothetical protein
MPWVSRSGSTGIDHSANGPGVPPTGYTTLLVTIAVNPHRNYVEVQNQSTALVALVRDDGTGNNQTVLMLAAASAGGGVGGDWTSDTFKGRLRIYGASGTQQVAAYED